jgi:DNA-binding beta-propeller fold protein YncE
MRVVVPVCLLVLVAGLSACASTPMEMTYFPEGEAETPRNWPLLPEVPRYRYAGQLVGEPNFRVAKAEQPGAAMRFLRWLAGLGAPPDTTRQLVRPQGGWVDDAGRIYVTDVGREAVFVFDEAQSQMQVWDRADRSAHFKSPVAVIRGAGSEIYVSDSELGRVVRLDADGSPLGSFGQGVLQRPTGLARDAASGAVFVADSAAHDIKVFDDHGRLLRTLGRRGAGPGEFNGPTHITIHERRLIVSDTLNARVQILDFDGASLGVIGRRGLYVGNLTRPKGVAVDDDGNFYIVESYYDHLLVFDRDGNFLLPIGGTGTALGKFFLPAGVWSDRNNRVYVADMFNGRVTIFQYLGE